MGNLRVRGDVIDEGFARAAGGERDEPPGVVGVEIEIEDLIREQVARDSVEGLANVYGSHDCSFRRFGEVEAVSDGLGEVGKICGSAVLKTKVMLVFSQGDGWSDPC